MPTCPVFTGLVTYAGTANQVANALTYSPVRWEQVLCIEVEAAGSMMQKARDNYREGPELSQLMDHFKQNNLIDDAVLAKRGVTQTQKLYSLYTVDGVLYYEGASA